MGHVQHGRNCNPFGNVATVSVVQDIALADHADIVYSVCNIFHSFISLFPTKQYRLNLATLCMLYQNLQVQNIAIHNRI